MNWGLLDPRTENDSGTVENLWNSFFQSPLLERHIAILWNNAIVFIHRNGMRSWPHLQQRGQHPVTQTPLLNTQLSVTLAGTHIFPLMVLPHFMTSLTLGLRREKIFSTRGDNVKRMPHVNITHRYSHSNANYIKVYTCTWKHLIDINTCIFPSKVLI